MCQQRQMTLFNRILSFHLRRIPLKRFHLGDVSFCLKQIRIFPYSAIFFSALTRTYFSINLFLLSLQIYFSFFFLFFVIRRKNCNKITSLARNATMDCRVVEKLRYFIVNFTRICSLCNKTFLQFIWIYIYNFLRIVSCQINL